MAFFNAARKKLDLDKKKAAQKKFKKFQEKRKCRFCLDRVKGIDYKDLNTLQKNLTPQGKLFSRKRSGCCTFHQKVFQTAVKRARFIALLPFSV